MFGRDTAILDRPFVIAHRGASGIAPENTLAAFEAAIAAGADGIELDVAPCATGELMVLHDDCVDRTTNGSGQLETMSFDALRVLDAGAWFGPEFVGERIPTLAEALDLAAGHVWVNIEIKGSHLRDATIADRIVALLRARGNRDRVLVSSFNPAILWRMARMAPQIPRALIYSPNLAFYLAHGWARYLVAPAALHPHMSLVNDAYMRSAHRRGYQVNVWTVNAPEDMRRMIALKVDGIITNEPARLRELLAR